MSPTPRFVWWLASTPVRAKQRADPILISLRAQQGATPPTWESGRRASPRASDRGGSTGGHHQQKQVHRRGDGHARQRDDRLRHERGGRDRRER